MDRVESYSQDLRLLRGWSGRVALSLTLTIVALLPFFASDYLIYLVTLTSIYAIGTLGQNILIGYTGQVSFGQAGFLAIGAYSFAHLKTLGVPFLLALGAAGLAAGLAGVLVGFPSLRLKGPYLSIATLGFGVAV